MYWVAVGFIALGIAAGIAPVIMNMLAAMDLTVKRNETTRRLEMAYDAVVARLAAPPGLPGLYAPSADTTSTTYSILPAISGVIPTTADGRYLVYCPYAPGETTLLAGPDSNYQPNGQRYQSSSQGGYVVRSDAPPAAITGAGIDPLAIIIAPKGQSTPSCADVTMRNRQPFVEGGIVRIVSRARGAAQTMAADMRTYEVFVSCTGSGDGRSSSAPMSLEAAADIFYNRRPRAMVMRLADCTYDAATLSRPLALDASGRGSRLVLASADADPGNGSPVLDAGSGSFVIQTDLGLNGIAINPLSTLELAGSAALQATDSAFGILAIAAGSRATLSGANSMTGAAIAGDLSINGPLTFAAGSPFSVGTSGNVVIASPSIFTGNFGGAGGLIDISGRVSIQTNVASAVRVVNPGGYAIRVASGGVLSVLDSGMDVQTSSGISAVYVEGGRLDVRSTNFGFNGVGGALITTAKGGELSLVANVNAGSPSLGGSRAILAVQLADPAPVRGSGNFYGATPGTCFGWYPALNGFYTSTGTYLMVSADVAFTDPTPATNVTAADMTADAPRQAANAVRAQLRSLLATSWVCSPS